MFWVGFQWLPQACKEQPQLLYISFPLQPSHNFTVTALVRSYKIMARAIICIGQSITYEINIQILYSCLCSLSLRWASSHWTSLHKLDTPRRAFLPYYKSPFSPAGDQNLMNKIFSCSKMLIEEQQIENLLIQRPSVCQWNRCCQNMITQLQL